MLKVKIPMKYDSRYLTGPKSGYAKFIFIYERPGRIRTISNMVSGHALICAFTPALDGDVIVDAVIDFAVIYQNSILFTDLLHRDLVSC